MEKNKRRKIIGGALCLAALLAALLLPQGNPLNGWEEQDFLSGFQQRRIRREITAIAESCRALYIGAEKQAPEDGGAEIRLSQEDIDAIEKQIMDAGYPVLDTDTVYPAYLANPEGLYAYWEKVTAGKDARQAVIRVKENGGFSYLLFVRDKGENYFFHAEIAWDERGDVYAGLCETLPIYDMEMTDWGIFYYQTYPKDVHYIDYSQIRMRPADRELYDLNLKYIRPVGYQFVNIFLCDWQEGEWGALSFNDLLDILYYEKTGEYFVWNRFPFRFNPDRAMIPAQLFEQTILAYFAVSPEELRQCAQYDAESGCYPWRPMYGDDITTWGYPMCEPEVVDWAQNSDGTITLTVQVYSPDEKTDRLFAHEVTVRPLEDGGFQYAANRVTYVSEHGLPPDMPRFALDDA